MMSVIESKENNDEEEVIEIGSYSEFKPGQKYPTPSPGYGDRVFYETLLKEKPNSEMAQDWCLAYGVLEPEAALKLYKLVCKRKGKPMTPVKTQKSPIKVKAENSKGSGRPSKKSKVLDDIVADTGFEQSSAWETKGSVGL